MSSLMQIAVFVVALGLLIRRSLGPQAARVLPFGILMDTGIGRPLEGYGWGVAWHCLILHPAAVRYV